VEKDHGGGEDDGEDQDDGEQDRVNSQAAPDTAEIAAKVVHEVRSVDEVAVVVDQAVVEPPYTHAEYRSRISVRRGDRFPRS
jgi:hypothetical protein